MKPPYKPSPGSHSPAQQSAQPGQRNQFKPGVAQPKFSPQPPQANRPAAPPVYRPQAPPRVLQTKVAVANQPVNQQRRAPVAPPVYRPQPVPKVLQTKMTVAAPARPNSKALPSVRPEIKPLQTKLTQPARAAVQMKAASPPIGGRIKLVSNPPGLPPLQPNRKVQMNAVVQCDRFRSLTSSMRVEVTMSKGKIDVKQVGGDASAHLTYSYGNDADLIQNDKEALYIEHAESNKGKDSGLGSILMYYAADVAVKIGKKLIRVTMPAGEAQGYYDKMGFVPEPKHEQEFIAAIKHGVGLEMAKKSKVEMEGLLKADPEWKQNRISELYKANRPMMRKVANPSVVMINAKASMDKRWRLYA